MRVLVTGATGLLGKYLASTASPGVLMLGLSRNPPITSEFTHVEYRSQDVLVSHQFKGVLHQFRPDVIIHAAAEGRVDVVEGRIKDFLAINVEAAGHIATTCERESIKFVFVSSNAVFGSPPHIYDDWDIKSPINDYGRLKAMAEDRIFAANTSALVIRPILMYGWPYPFARANPLAAWVRALSVGQPISVVSDLWTQPVSARDVALAIWKALEFDLEGPVNVSGGETINMLEFAQLVARTFDLPTGLVVSTTLGSLTNLAPRPRLTEYTLSRLHQELSFQPLGLRSGLRYMRETQDHVEQEPIG